MSEFNQLITYLTVVETKSFTAAADKLGVSANAISKQISHLEEQLSLTLLSRSTRHLEVTEAGQVIYEKAKIAKESLDDINQYASALQREPKGTLSIVSSVGIGQYILTQHLPEFLELYPDLDLNLQFSDQFPDLYGNHGESIDIAYGFAASLIPEHCIHANLVRHRINCFNRIICAAPKYLKQHSEPKAYEDLQNHCLIAHSKNIHHSLLIECKKRHINFKRILTINNSASILNLVINGNGIAAVPDFVIKNELASGALKPILQIHQEPKVAFYLFYKKTTYMPIKITRFLDFFEKKSKTCQ